MALKTHLNEEEKFSLTHDEIQLAERYLRKFKTAGALRDNEAMMVYELYMIGTSFKDMHLQYPHFPLEQIILTAALRKWALDRDRMMCSLRERVQAKIVKSVVESVDFFTTMISVASAEYTEEMHNYVKDPLHKPKPAIRIKSIKDFKEVMDSIQKLVDSSAGNSSKPKSTAMLGVLEHTTKLPEKLKKPKPQDDSAMLLAEIVEEDDGE